MEDRTKDPARALERMGDELEEDIQRLDDHIHDAARKTDALRDDQTAMGVVHRTDMEPIAERLAGDWHDTQDDAGGEDPEGAAA